MTLWSKAEQQAIKPVSANKIDLVFDNLSTEVQLVDLRKLISNEFYNDLINNSDNYADLLDGTTYEYNDVTYTVNGLKKVLAYSFYIRYIAESNVSDTFSGMVHKDFDESVRVGQGTIKNLQDEARAVAMNYWKECKDLMEQNISDYPYWNCKKKTSKINVL